MSCCICRKKLKFKRDGCSLFGIPRDPIVRQKWYDVIRKRSYMPTINSKVCSRHFQKEDIVVQFGQRKVREGAIPTILEYYDKENITSENSTKCTIITHSTNDQLSSTSDKPVVVKLEVEESHENAFSMAITPCQELSDDRYELNDRLIVPDIYENTVEKLTKSNLLGNVATNQESFKNGHILRDLLIAPATSKLQYEELNNHTTGSKELSIERHTTESTEVALSEEEAVVELEFEESSNSNNEEESSKEDDFIDWGLRKRKVYLGDFTIEDMVSPVKAIEFYKRVQVRKQKDRTFVKTCTQGIRRLKKRVQELKKQLQEEKASRQMDKAYLLFLKNSRLSEDAKNILIHLLEGAPKAYYPPVLKEFASILYSHSPSAYKYVRKTFEGALPHPTSFSRWQATQSKTNLEVNDIEQISFELDESDEANLQVNNAETTSLESNHTINMNLDANDSSNTNLEMQNTIGTSLQSYCQINASKSLTELM